MGGTGQVVAGKKKPRNCETPHDLETSCTLEPILSAVCEKNLFCFILSSFIIKPHFSHTTGSHANRTMQVTQWQIAVQTQVSSETPHDLNTLYPIEPILQVVREKNFFCFIRSSAQTWVVHQSPEAFILQNILFLLSKHPHKLFCPFNAKKWSFDGGRHFNFGSFWDWEWLLTLKAQIQDGGNENTLNCIKYLLSVHTFIKRYPYFNVLYQSRTLM